MPRRCSSGMSVSTGRTAPEELVTCEMRATRVRSVTFARIASQIAWGEGMGKGSSAETTRAPFIEATWRALLQHEGYSWSLMRISSPGRR